MITEEEWLAVNSQRAIIYQWFGNLFACEQTAEQLACYSNNEMNRLYELFVQIGLDEEADRLKTALIELFKDEDVVLELSADFAQHFLLDDKASTLPYASFYLEKGRLYGDVESKMSTFLAENFLQISADFKEPSDHLAVYLYLMSHWIIRDKNYSEHLRIDAEQLLFLQNGLLSWLPQFVMASQKQSVKYDIYPAVSSLLLAFIQIDVLLLTQSPL